MSAAIEQMLERELTQYNLHEWGYRRAARKKSTPDQPPFDPPRTGMSPGFDSDKTHCKNCSRRIDKDSIFCKYCGKSVRVGNIPSQSEDLSSLK